MQVGLRARRARADARALRLAALKVHDDDVAKAVGVGGDEVGGTRRESDPAAVPETSTSKELPSAG
jgi:hypothetical protein